MMVVFKKRDSVPSARYSSVCNVLRQSRIWLIPTYCERSELSGEFNGTNFLYIYIIYMFQAVRRAVNVLNVSTCI